MATSRNASNYRKLTQKEHCEIRAGMYIGSTKASVNDRVLYDHEKGECFFKKEVVSCDGIEQIFGEVISNAFDNLVNTMKFSDSAPSKKILTETKGPHITVSVEGDRITVKNGGECVPIVQSNDDSKMLVPDMIFGELLSGSNYDDHTDKRTTAGMNGYGAKLANIFSKEFSVKIGDPNNGLTYHGVWEDNMNKKSKSKTSIGNKKQYTGPPYVEISYRIDFSKFEGFEKVTEYSSDMISAFAKRVFDLTYAIKFTAKFNGSLVDGRLASTYTKALYPNSGERMVVHYEWWSKKDAEAAANAAKGGRDGVSKAIVAMKCPMPAVELVVVDTPNEASVNGFVNGVATKQGGVHITDAVYKVSSALAAAAGDKISSKVSPADTRPHFSVIICMFNTPNPEFSSQIKEFYTSPRPPLFGVGKELFKGAMTSTSSALRWRIVDMLNDVLALKEQREISKTNAGRRSKRIALKAGEDANDAGTSKSDRCTLYLVEGESAAAHIKMRISMSPGGKDLNGYFPMKGKPINAMTATSKALSKNAEVTTIKELVGISDNVDYSDPKVASAYLRYGRIIIAADQDVDGFHVRALVVNLFMRWPSLVREGRIAYLATPLIRVIDVSKGRKCVRRFFNEKTFDDWVATLPKGELPANYRAVYLKGLASSSKPTISEDMYHSPCIVLLFDDTTEESMSLAFGKKRAGDRKSWITDWMVREKVEDFEMMAVSEFIKQSTVQKEVPSGRRPVGNMIHSDLTVYSAHTLFRSIPSIYDGLKRSQRQALFHALEYWNYGNTAKEPVKIARLSSAAAERVLYQHGENSMYGTYIKMAQTFVGMNNLTVFEQDGMFGTRNSPKDAGAPRYIATRLIQTLARSLFTKESVSLATERTVEGEKVEPYFLPCDLPLGVINGVNGIATGYKSYLPPHNPFDIADWLIEYITTGKIPTVPKPWFRGFSGEVYHTNKKVKISSLDDGDASSSDEEQEDDDDADVKTDCGDGPLALVTEGKFKITKEYGDGSYDVKITELPINTWTGVYRKMLEMWIAKGRLGDIRDLSLPDTVDIELSKLRLSVSVKEEKQKEVGKKKATAKKKAAPSSSESEIKSDIRPTLQNLKLVKNFSMRTITFIDDDGIPTVYENTNEILRKYADRMLKHYEVVKTNKIKCIERSLVELEKKHRLVISIVESKLKVIGRPEGEIEEQIKKLDICKETYENFKLKDATKEKADTIVRSIKELTEALDKLKKTPSSSIWLDRINNAKNAIDDYFKNVESTTTPHVQVVNIKHKGRTGIKK